MRAILTYHSIDESRSPISLSPGAFRRHIEFFMSAAVPIVPVNELLQQDGERDGVALTFDDGYANLDTEAAPVLADHRLPATIFAATAFVGRTNAWAAGDAYDVPSLPLLDWDALGRLRERGFDVGSHTRNHRHLTALSQAEIDEEIDRGAEDVQERLGIRPVGLAYPYGELNDAVRAAAARRHAWACTTTFAELSDDDRLALPRIDMWYFEKPGLLESWGTAEFRRWVKRREVLRQARSVIRKVTGR